MAGDLAVPGLPALAEPPPRRRRRVVMGAILLAVVVVAAGLGGYFYLAHRPGPVTAPVIADGPTFYQALGALNSSVGNESGGPWFLFSVAGIASQVHFSPNVISYYTINASIVSNGCQADLSGLTMFNGTIPRFHGTFNSGTAPFWQLAFYSNISKEILVGTDVLGVTHLSLPIPLASACAAAWYKFVLSPSQWLGQIYSNSSLPVNSPDAAQVVWTDLGAHFADQWAVENAPLAEMYMLGPAMLERTFAAPPGGNWNIDFLGCGLAGYTGNRGTSYAGVTRDGQYSGDFNATENCALLNRDPGFPAYYYDIPFSSPSETANSTTEWAIASYQVNANYTNGSPAFTDVWGLANWMASLNLTSRSGQALPLASSGCPNWVSATSDCVASGSGWYAVLLSQGGEWLASYGMTQNGPGWSVPVTAMVSHQQIEIVVPNSWNVTGDRLGVNSTISSVTVTGTISL